MQEEYHCSHDTDELLMCVAEECRDDDTKHVVCTKCCFLTHAHGLMNFKRLTPFEKHCYRISPLLDKKAGLEEFVRTKFRTIKQQLQAELDRKQQYMLGKLNNTLPEDVEVVVRQAFVKNEIMDLLPEIAEEVVSRIKDITQVQKSLNQFEKDVSELSMDEGFVFNSSPVQFSMIETDGTKSPQNQKVKTENKENFRLAKIKYISLKESKQADGTILIDLQQATCIPNNIEGESFAAVSNILRNHSDIANVTITINCEQQEENPQTEDIDELCKKKFFLDLRCLQQLEDLNLIIGRGNKLSGEDLYTLENALLSLESMRRFRASYHASEEEAMIYCFPRLLEQLGSQNLQIRVRS